MDTATIFVDAAAWAQERLPFLGIRFGTQGVPHGCFVAGFIAPEGEVLHAPYLRGAEQERHWETALHYARGVVKGGGEDAALSQLGETLL